LLQEPNRDVRKAAAESVSAGLAEGIKAQTFIFNTVMADHMVNDQLYGYASWVASRNLANEASDASVQALIDSVVDRYELVRRYYSLKKKLLGYDEFHDYDRYASVGSDETFWSWEDARDIVVKAYTKFDPRAGEIAQMFFDRNWIHAPVRKGKNGGAYSAGTIASAHPYVFMNYTGTNRDVQVLAHELGHGIHQYLSRQQGPLLMDTPLTVAETASVFGEILTFNLLYEAATDDKTRLTMLMTKLDDILSTVFRQIALNRFEDAIHVARRSEGELSTERLSEIWVTTQSVQFGDTVKLSPGYKYWWSYISHFMHVPGYVYAYAYGELLVLALYEIYKSDKSGFPDKYIEMLSSGGSKKPTDLLAPFNVNVEDPEFWKIGLGVIDRLITEAERLAAQ
jgi:oligoendopeptidase F